MNDHDVTTLFEGWVERHVVHDEELDPAVLCADRPEELKALQSLIFRYRKVSDSLDGVPMTASRGTAVAAGRTPLLPALEGFRTIERIGVGGMGEVYKLQDLKLGRLVAAKVLRADRGVTPNLAEFLSEAQTLALFQDRRIVQIHELRDKAVPPVLIMEYIDGFELGRLAPSLEYHQRARIVKEVCEAVHHAHQLGVQHRDLKPSNIMLDAQLQPKILDFGLSSSDSARGHFRGTPQYLAPEQLDASQPIDARTDVYGLGAVLYEVLTGVPPVDGPTVDAIVANVRAGAVRLPDEISVGTPEPLQAIALKALETRPADRYASAQDMALDLGLYLSGRPVTARPSRDTTIQGLKETSAARTGVVPKAGWSGAVTRRRAWAAAGVFLTAAVGVGFWFARHPRPTESVTPPRLGTGGPASTNAEANRHFTIAMERLKGVSYDIPRAREALDRALAADPRFAAARAWKAFTTFLTVDGGFAADSALLNEAEEEMRHALRDEPTLARAHLGIAALYLMRGRRDMMPTELDQVLKGDPNDEDALFFLMQYHHYAGEYVPALDLAARILDRSPLFWPARINLGHMLQQQGDIPSARREFGKVLEQDPRNAAALGFLARTSLGSSDLKEARRSLDLVAPEQRRAGYVRLVSATLLAREGHREQALRAMDQELLNWGALVAYSQADFAAFYAVQGDAVTALDWLDRAVRGGDERAEWFRDDPLLANIRDRPRFKQIMETIAYRRQGRNRQAPAPSAPPAMAPIGSPTAVPTAVPAAAAAIVGRTTKAPDAAKSGKPTRIVVLPFENLGAPEDAYFAPSLTEAFISRLSNLQGLSVISRTTARVYDRKGKTTAQIGTDLGVDFVLEGSVSWDRGAGRESRVRITPALTQVTDDTQVWAGEYDRVTSDIFAIQSEVAENVVRAMGVKLVSRELTALKAVATNDAEAYRFYLRGLDSSDRGPSRMEQENGIGMFQSAVDRDPRFTQALARLARAHARMYFSFDRSQERLDKTKDALDRLAAQGPDLAETHIARAFFQYWVIGDYPRALDEFKTALSLQPNNAEVLEGISYVLKRQGRWQESVEQSARWLELDPRGNQAPAQHGQTCVLVRRYAEADRVFALAVSPNPQNGFAWAWRALIQLLWHGDVEKARSLVSEAWQVPRVGDPQYWLAHATFRIALVRRDFREALRLLDDEKGEAFQGPLTYLPIENLRGEVHRLSGANDLARISFEAGRRRLLELIAKEPDESRYYSALGIAYAGLGLREEALRSATRGTELMPPSKDLWKALPRVEDLAAVHTMLGQQDEAIERLDFLLSRTGEISTHMLRLEPRWDPLKSNPRFQALLAKYGDPPS